MNIKAGVIAGFVATVALSLLMIGKAQMGMMAPAATLMLHLVWGTVLGITYSKLAGGVPTPATST